MIHSSIFGKSSAATLKPIIAGGLVVSLITLLVDFNGVKTLLSDPIAFASRSSSSGAVEQLSSACTGEILSSAQLSREQLAQLLTVPERDSKQRIRQIVDQPYCQLAPLSVRAGVEAEREAYPLAFAPDKTFIILYEDGEYAGYDFKL